MKEFSKKKNTRVNNLKIPPQSDDAELQSQFVKLAQQLADNETQIVDELNAVQGQPMDIGGYYHPNDQLSALAMRPSSTFNEVLALVNA